MAKNIDFMGAIFPDVPSVKLPQQGGGLVSFDDTTDATATADKILQGYTAYAGGEKLVGTASGGSAVIEPLSVTANGTYSAPSGVDGYSPVTVNVSGGGGGDHDAEDAIITKTISGTYTNDRISFIASYAFMGCQNLSSAFFPNLTGYIGFSAFSSCTHLETISAPNATSISAYAFGSCSRLSQADFPNATYVSANAFGNCSNLTTANFPKASVVPVSGFCRCYALTDVNFPSATAIYSGAFSGCSAITTLSFPNVSYISQNAFNSCRNLMSIYLLSTSFISLTTQTAFYGTPMSNSTYTGSFGSIYVPASMVSSYKTRTNWNYYKDRITAYEGE